MTFKEKLAEFWYKNFSKSYLEIKKIKIKLNYHTAEGKGLLTKDFDIEPSKTLYCEDDSWNIEKRKVAEEYCERDPINKNITTYCEGFYRKIKKHKYAVGLYRQFETSILKGFFWEIDEIITENVSYQEYLKHKEEIECQKN